MPEKTIIDRVFGIPRGAEEEYTFRDENETNFDVFSDAEGTSEYSEADVVDFEDDYYGEEFEEEEISAPVEFFILSQTVRRVQSGMQVVDVLFEVEDILGAQNYEFQVTKA